MCGSELCDRWLETDCTGRRHVAGPLASFPFFPHLLLRYHRTNEHRMATGQAPPSAPSKRPFVSLTPTWICIRFRLSSDKSDPVITLDILVFFFFLEIIIHHKSKIRTCPNPWKYKISRYPTWTSVGVFFVRWTWTMSGLRTQITSAVQAVFFPPIYDEFQQFVISPQF